jgi:cobalt-zinc-cadmium efflux system protein
VKALLRHPALHWALALVVGGVFLYACWDKILEPRKFAAIVYQYQVIGPSARVGFLPANLLAVTLPWVELVVGLLLVTGLWRREAAAVAGGMLVMFLAAIGIATAQGIDVANCGCFSVGEHGRTPGWQLVLQDLALLTACAVLAWLPAARARERAASAEPAPAR